MGAVPGNPPKTRKIEITLMKHLSLFRIAAALAAAEPSLTAAIPGHLNILIPSTPTTWASATLAQQSGVENPDTPSGPPRGGGHALHRRAQLLLGVCTPSRYALLTGRHHWRDFHGIAGAFESSVFKPGQLTLPAMLRKQGYATACIGKWHLGMDWDAIRKPGTPKKSIEHTDFDWSKPFPGGPLDHGFDHYFGDNVINFRPYAWIENDRLVAAPDMTFKNTPKNTKEGSWGMPSGPGVRIGISIRHCPRS